MQGIDSSFLLQYQRNLNITPHQTGVYEAPLNNRYVDTYEAAGIAGRTFWQTVTPSLLSYTWLRTGTGAFVSTGTEIATGANAPLYYITGANQVSLTGGILYPSSFTSFPWINHTYPDSRMQAYTSSAVKQAMDRTLSYITQRGFSHAPPDFPVGWENVFWNIPANYTYGIGFNVTGPNATTISQVDFVAQVNPSAQYSRMILSLNTVSYEPFRHRPIRIDCSLTYQAYLNAVASGAPAAFWDSTFQQLSINVPTQRQTFDTTFINTGAALFIREQQYLNRFEGAFVMMARDASGRLIRTNNYRTCEAFVQSSPNVWIEGTNTRIPFNATTGALTQSQTMVRSINGQISNQFYGYVIPRMNGGNNSFDMYYIPVGNSSVCIEAIGQGGPVANTRNAVATTGAPGSFLTTDATNTSFISTGADRYMVYMPLSYWESPLLPEQIIATSPAPLDLTVPVADRPNWIVLHEYFHDVQFGSSRPIYWATNGEGQTTAISNDPRGTNGCVYTAPSIYSGWMLPFFRGKLTYGMKGPDRGNNAASNNNNLYTDPFIASTQFDNNYGASLGYYYLRYGIDQNYQLIRRANEILSTQTLMPLLSANNLGDYMDFTFWGGYKLALQQASSEVLGRDLKDIFFNTSVAVSLCRANPSIPTDYRFNFPMWYWSSGCTYGNFGFYQTLDRNWFDAFDGGLPMNAYNNIIPSSYSTSTTANIYGRALYPALGINGTGPASIGGGVQTGGIHQIPYWPRVATAGSLFYYADTGSSNPYNPFYIATGGYVSYMDHSVDDLACLAYILPDTFTGCQLLASTGEFRAMAYRYSRSSDIDSTGTWSQAGPYNLTNGVTQDIDLTTLHSGGTGLRKLVVTNNKITDYGGLRNYFTDVERVTGQLRINAS